MNLTALCPRRTTLLTVLANIESAGLAVRQGYTQPDLFLEKLTAEQPHYALLTSESLSSLHLLEQMKRAAPNCQLILCLLPDAVATIGGLWPMLDTLDFDVLCSFDELPICLTTLKAGHHYTTSLLATSPVYQKKETLSGFNKLTSAERGIMALMLKGMNGKDIADVQCISPHTLRNEKASISQKLGVSGGPGSLISFVLINAEKIKRLLAE